jgi:hypothetical protein
MKRRTFLSAPIVASSLLSNAQIIADEKPKMALK